MTAALVFATVIGVLNYVAIAVLIGRVQKLEEFKRSHESTCEQGGQSRARR